MSTPDLTPTLRETLNKALGADRKHGFLSYDEYDALVALRDACPERPRLEDGIYEVPDSDGDYRLRYVRDGRHATYRQSDGALYNGGLPLPADTSTWRRIVVPPTVTPEQIEAAARVVSGYTEPQWVDALGVTRDFYRTRVRTTLAAAGIEAQS